MIPVATEMEHADTYPEAIVEQMKALGLFGITIPEEYGGLGLDLLTYIGVVEELAYGWMSLSGDREHAHDRRAPDRAPRHRGAEAALVAAHGDRRDPRLPLALGIRRGQRHPQPLVPGRARRRRVRRHRHEDVGDERRARGHRRARGRAPTKGISCLIVEKDPGPRFGGITVSRNIGKLGYKGIETVEMVYDGHRVPADALLGDAGRGLGYILGALEVGRINIAARAGRVSSRAAFDAAIAYAQERRTMGKPIAEHQAIQMKLADMATKLEAARLLTRSAAERKQAGRARRRRGGDGEAVRERDRVRDRDRGACGSTAASATPPSCRSSATTATRR